MRDWAKWLEGLIGAFIGAAANTITVLIIDPAKFSPSADGGWRHLGTACLVSGIVGAALFLRQRPTPEATPILAIADKVTVTQNIKGDK